MIAYDAAFAGLHHDIHHAIADGSLSRELRRIKKTSATPGTPPRRGWTNVAYDEAFAGLHHDIHHAIADGNLSR